MRILVINPNASVEMTDVIRQQLLAVARPDVQLDVVNPPGAPPAIESALDEAACIPLMLGLVQAAQGQGYHAVVIACFSDPGLDAAREATDLPVVGIQDAAMHLAAQLGYRFSVLTTLAHRAPLRERAALVAGLDRRLASCRPLDLPVLETVQNREQVVEKIVSIGRLCVEQDGAEVLILGCAGLGDLAATASRKLGVPVIDPNAAALKLCETLVDLGLSHSRAGLYHARSRAESAPPPASRMFSKSDARDDGWVRTVCTPENIWPARRPQREADHE